MTTVNAGASLYVYAWYKLWESVLCANIGSKAKHKQYNYTHYLEHGFQDGNVYLFFRRLLLPEIPQQLHFRWICVVLRGHDRLTNYFVQTHMFSHG